jgi:hypothetical protein
MACLQMRIRLHVASRPNANLDSNPRNRNGAPA